MSKSIKQTLEIDINKYQHFLDDANIPQEQKEELLKSLWSIVCEFIKIGWDVKECKNDGDNPPNKTKGV